MADADKCGARGVPTVSGSTDSLLDSWNLDAEMLADVADRIRDRHRTRREMRGTHTATGRGIQGQLKDN